MAKKPKADETEALQDTLDLVREELKGTRKALFDLVIAVRGGGDLRPAMNIANDFLEGKKKNT